MNIQYRVMSRYIFFAIICVNLVSCKPVVKYNGKNMVTPENSDKLITVYEQGHLTPPNVIKIGEIKISDSGFSTDCSLTVVTDLAKKQARDAGGDAIAITKLAVPDVISTCYRMNADVLVFDYPSVPYNWEKVSLTEDEIKQYLDENIDSLSAIEGIWKCNEGGTWIRPGTDEICEMPYMQPYRMAIIKNRSSTERQYVAFLLEPDVKRWAVGSVKAYFNQSENKKEYQGFWYHTADSLCQSMHYFDDKGLLRNNSKIKCDTLEYNLRTALERIYPPVKAQVE